LILQKLALQCAEFANVTSLMLAHLLPTKITS
jgi:hypothetical protein